MARSLKNMMGAGLGAESASLINGVVIDGLVATGSSQTDALLLTSDVNVVGTVDTGTGVRLRATPQPGDECVVANLGANQLNVYPALGGTIQGGALNAAYLLSIGAAASFVARTGSLNWTVLSSGGSVNGGALGGAGTLSAPTLGYPSPLASNPTTLAVSIGGDWQSGDVLKLAYSSAEAMTSPTILTHTLIDADVSGGTISLSIPTLSSATYFQSLGSHSGVDSANLSNKVKWGDTTAPTITSSATQSQMELFPLAVSLTANETVSWSITGGLDQTQFTIVGSTLEWFANGTQNYDVPADSDMNNSYVVQVSATDLGGNITNQTITVTVTAADKQVDAFSLGANVGPGATPATVYQAPNLVTVSGLTPGITVPFAVTNGLAKKNTGSYVASGSVQNSDTLQVEATAPSTGATSVTLAIGSGASQVTGNWAVITTSDPSSLPNLQVWLDPSDLTTMFQSGTRASPGTAVAADGDPVGLILDKSGNNNDFTASGTARPLYKTAAGKKWLLFDGVDDLLATSFSSTIGVATIVAAMNAPSDFANFRAGMSDFFGGTINKAFARNSGNWVAGASDTLGATGREWANKTTQTSAITFDTVMVYSADGTGMTDPLTFTSGIRLGAGGGANVHMMLYGLVCAGSSNAQILSTTDRHSAEDYLAAKSGAY